MGGGRIMGGWEGGGGEGGRHQKVLLAWVEVNVADLNAERFARTHGGPGRVEI